MESFVVNFCKMGIVSMFGLVVVVLMLIYNIDKVFNSLWYEICKWLILFLFLFYVLLLVFVLFFMGMSIVISFYIMLLWMFSDLEVFLFGNYLLNYVLFLFMWLLFSLIYWLVLNIKVKWYYVLIGVLLVGIFFMFGK